MDIKINSADRKLVAVANTKNNGHIVGLWLRGEDGQGCVFFGGKEVSNLHSQSLESMIGGRTPIYEGDSITITL